MAEQPGELRCINWSRCCSFTNIFRTFRMAIHPSKLGLALAGLLLTGLVGVVLDGVWRQDSQPVSGEIDAFSQVADIDAWRDQMREVQLMRLLAGYAQLKIATPEKLDLRFRKDPDDEVNALQDHVVERYKTRIKELDRAKVADTAREMNALYMDLEALKPQGIFSSFVSFETGAIRDAIAAAAQLNFSAGLEYVLNVRQERKDLTLLPTHEALGVLAHLVLVARGVQWAIAEHFFFSILLFVAILLIWSLFGGAICRLAALNVARDERLSPKAALAFAGRKYLGFLTAPLLPIALIVLIGIPLAIGGLVTAIPGIGELLGGLGMILALAGGFVVALVVIGGVAGFSLMYPTIAVEGSDSFDAMSRSYSYVYSRPWRAAFYAMVALVYGGLCYLFVRFFVLVLLKATHCFVNIGLSWTERPGTGRLSATKLDAMWPSPSLDGLWRTPAPLGMEHWEQAGAFLIAIWLLIIVTLLWAFLVSFYLSGSTIIYYLLRREVDATDIEDVHLDEEEETSPVSPPSGAMSEAPPPSPPPDVSPPLATEDEE